MTKFSARSLARAVLLLANDVSAPLAKLYYNSLSGGYDAEDSTSPDQISQALRATQCNRYSNILPFDSHLVSCSSGYVNASKFSLGSEPYMDESQVAASPGQSYIIASGPMHPNFHGKNTVPEFWKMIQENGVRVVVALCKFEPGFTGCADYIATHPEIVSVQQSESLNDGKIIVSQCDLKNGPNYDSYSVTHIHFLDWPNYGVPDTPVHFVELLNVVDNAHMHWTQKECSTSTVDHNAPLLVHCSGGVGRSGTFVSVHAILHQVMASAQHGHPLKTSDELIQAVNSNIEQMRRYRHQFMVEGTSQYHLIYRTMGLWATDAK